MFGLSPFELMLVGVVAILLFGSKLPDVARTLGQQYSNLRRSLSDLQSQFNINELTNPPPSSGGVKSYDELDEPSFKKPSAPKFTPPPKATGDD